MVKMIEQPPEEGAINIKVVGVGNAGGNIVSRIYDKIEDVSFVIFNTEKNALKHAKGDVKIQIGEKTTHGMGAGKDPEKGKFAANEDKEKIADILSNTNIVFLIAGLGGGTGTGSSPVIAKIAKDLGAIVISLVTTPFEFEGEKRMEHAFKGLEILLHNVDTLIHIPNQKLYEIVDSTTSFTNAFGKVDEIIARTISSVSDLINKPKLLDIDFADICSVVQNGGKGIVGIGYGEGENRMEESTRQILEDPLIEKSEMMEAKNILISITGGNDLTLVEIGETMKLIQSKISSSFRVLGVSLDENLKNAVKVTLLATGIGKKEEMKKISKKRNEELPLGNEPKEIKDIDTPTIVRKKGERL